ncbi:MAG: hypothetical protein Q9174_000268 [Haloplaca sp. 1 TL-2023]
MATIETYKSKTTPIQMLLQEASRSRTRLLQQLLKLWHSFRTIDGSLTWVLRLAKSTDIRERQQDLSSENERSIAQPSSIDFPPTHNPVPPETIPPFQSPRPRELLPSMLARSPPGRSSTLPPIQRKDRPARPRKSSITQNSRKAKHEKTKSKDYARRLSMENRRPTSADAQGKRWEDLLEAATSANEADSDRDLTPNVSQAFAQTVCMRYLPSRPEAGLVQDALHNDRDTRLFNST